MDFRCSDAAVGTVERRPRILLDARLISLSLAKTDLVSLDDFYTKQLSLLLRQRNSTPYVSKPELSTLMQCKLTRGKWRPRLMDFVSSLDEPHVQSASERAFQSLPDIAKAITELTTLKGVCPATASAVLAAYAPEIAPFMSDEAMVAAIGSSKDYTLKQYLIFAEKLQTKAKELSLGGDLFTPSDVERALWSSSVGAKLQALPSQENPKASSKTNAKRKMQR